MSISFCHYFTISRSLSPAAKDGDCCSVCLEDFDEDAIVASSSSSSSSSGLEQGSHVQARLLALRPPVVALRCGHALHLECAEQCVRAAAGRHVRCPLCREPATLSGAAAARAFG